jgi:hypothetical protein
VSWRLVLLLFATGCGGERVAQPAPSAPPDPASAPQAPTTPSEARAQAPTPQTPDPTPAPPAIDFPPPNFRPPHERSAQPGDGQWVRLGGPGERAGDGEPVLFRTVVHPHSISKWISVTVVAINLERAALHLVAGTEDPVSKTAPPELRTGLVPPEHHDSLIAVMNGGWKTAHGQWGVQVGGHTFVPPRPEGCTVAIFRDGHVRVRSWPALEPQLSEIEAYRQTPPCLIESGAIHPLLAAGQERPWGGMSPKEKTRRRSALGADASGRILFYGFGEEAGAKLLAEGMRIAGALEAAETDINYSWTRFLLFGQKGPDRKLQVTSTLVPQMVHQKTGYVERAMPRDFFYLRRR